MDESKRAHEIMLPMLVLDEMSLRQHNIDV